MRINPKNFIQAYYRTRSILLDPQKEWTVIAQKEENKSDLIKNYALPLIAVCSLVVFAGILINYSSFSHAIKQMFVIFLSLSGGLYLATQIIRGFAPSFKASNNENRNFMLVVYATSIFCLFHAVANIFAPSSFLSQLCILFELYFLRLFWLGATPLLDIPENKKAGFTLMSGLIILIIPLILEKMFSILFAVPTLSI